MHFSPRARRLGLTAHITASLGWFGAVAGFLALGIAGLTSDDPQLVRASYLSMELVGWLVIVPFSLAALLSGIVQSLGTRWGLLEHYWVLAKLVITVVATALLLLHMGPTSRLAEVAATATLGLADLRELRVQLVADAVGAMIALLLATALAVHKPRGLTPFGLRARAGRQLDARSDTAAEAAVSPIWGRTLALVIIGLLVLFLIAHLAGGGMSNHRELLSRPH